MSLFMEQFLRGLAIGEQLKKSRAMKEVAPPDFSMTNEFQDILDKARQGETVSDPWLNPEIQRQFPDWIIPQQVELSPNIRGTISRLVGKALPEQTFQTAPGNIYYPELPVGVISPEVMGKRTLAEETSQGLEQALKALGLGNYTYPVLKGLEDLFGQTGMETITPDIYPEKPQKPEKPSDAQRKYEEYQEYLDLDAQIKTGLANPEALARHKYLAAQSHIAGTLKAEKRDLDKEVEDLRKTADRMKARGAKLSAFRKYEDLADEVEDQLIREKQSKYFPSGPKIPTGTGMGELMKQGISLTPPAIPGMTETTPGASREEAQKAFDAMQGAGLSAQAMKERVNRNRDKLVSMGVDVEYLLSLIR